MFIIDMVMEVYFVDIEDTFSKSTDITHIEHIIFIFFFLKPDFTKRVNNYAWNYIKNDKIDDQPERYFHKIPTIEFVSVQYIKITFRFEHASNSISIPKSLSVYTHPTLQESMTISHGSVTSHIQFMYELTVDITEDQGR